jgi:hypothetical protein
MCPENVFPLLRHEKTITAICFAWQSEIFLALLVTLIGHSRRPDFGHIFSFVPKKCDYFYFLKAMCPENYFPLLRLVKTITAICFSWLSEIMTALLVTLIGHSRRLDFGHILFICAQIVQLFLFFEGNVPPK